MSDWVRVRSWHVAVDGDQSRTLCGLKVAAHPTPPWEHQIAGWSAVLPMGEKSCEACLRQMARRDES